MTLRKQHRKSSEMAVPVKRSLLKLTKDEKKEFLDSFDYVCLGCDGVLWTYFESKENNEINFPNAAKAIKLLIKAGKKIVFISNNSLRTDEQYIQKLEKMGVANVDASDIFHPAKTIASYCSSRIKDRPIYSLCSKNVNEMLKKQDINIIQPLTERFDTKLDMREKEPPVELAAAVVIDTNFNLHFSHLTTALQHLKMNDDCKLLIGSPDRILPLRKDLTCIGPGGLANILKICSGKEAIVLGKPGRFLCCMLKKQYDMGKPIRTVLIGDNLKTDIRFGNESGFQTLLVFSGVSTKEDMCQAGQSKPTFWLNSIGEFVDFFKGLKNYGKDKKTTNDTPSCSEKKSCKERKCCFNKKNK